jgi:outer membrane immunogenic protein
MGSSSRLATNWTLGGGFEYAIWKGVSFKSEYLYVDLDDNRDRAVRLTAQPFPTYRPSSFTASRIEPLHTIRFGLNFKVIPAIRHFMEEGLGSK